MDNMYHNVSIYRAVSTRFPRACRCPGGLATWRFLLGDAPARLRHLAVTEADSRGKNPWFMGEPSGFYGSFS